MTQWLIYFSQGINRCHGGDPDEMFSSRCWREQDHRYYGWWRNVLDNWIPWPSSWNEPSMTHCESCYHAEIQRAKEFYESRIK